MKRPNARKGRSERRYGRRPIESSRDVGRPAPRLILVVELEELPHVAIHAASAEDEARLVAWLGRAGTRERLQECVEDALGEFRKAA